MTALVLAEHDNANFNAATLHAVTAAKKAGGDVHILVAGTNAKAVADAAAKVAGVSKVLLADDPAYEFRLAENVAPLLVKLAPGYDQVFAVATTNNDIVDSGGTLCNAAVALMDQGATSVSAYITHGVLSGGAVARVAASPIEKMVITDSIMPTEAVRVSPNIRPLSIASLMAEAMRRITDEASVSSLFD